jgi:hypothetical protein
MNWKDKILWLLGLHLKRDPDNFYSYICRRCGMYFITVGQFDFPFHDEITRGGMTPPDPDCKCLRIYKLRYWAN